LSVGNPPTRWGAPGDDTVRKFLASAFYRIAFFCGRFVMSKKSTRVVAALATALIASTVLASSAAEAAPKTLTIVYQGPLTGANAQTGQDQVLGVKTALEIYNATNPAVKVNLLQADDQGDASVASTVAAGIATNPSVIGVVGPAYSGASIASFPAYIASGLPQVSPSATNVSLTDPKSPNRGFPFFHRVIATDALQGPALVRFAVKGVSSPKIYVIDDQSSYSTGLRDLVNTYISAQKLTKIGSDSIPAGTIDFTSAAAKIKSAAANVVIYTGYYSDAGKLAKALHDNGYTGVFAGGDGVLNNGFIPAAGAPAAEGARLTSGSIPFELAASEAEKAAFTKTTGLASAAGHAYVTEAFNATNVFLDLIAKGDLTRPAIESGIANGTFPIVGGGSISFTRYGEVKGGAPIGGFQVVNGVIKYLGAE